MVVSVNFTDLAFRVACTADFQQLQAGDLGGGVAHREPPEDPRAGQVEDIAGHGAPEDHVVAATADGLDG
jgi:hypothetical protein